MNYLPLDFDRWKCQNSQIDLITFTVAISMLTCKSKCKQPSIRQTCHLFTFIKHRIRQQTHKHTLEVKLLSTFRGPPLFIIGPIFIFFKVLKFHSRCVFKSSQVAKNKLIYVHILTTTHCEAEGRRLATLLIRISLYRITVQMR